VRLFLAAVALVVLILVKLGFDKAEASAKKRGKKDS
jgi:hypothetical protein